MHYEFVAMQQPPAAKKDQEALEKEEGEPQ